MRARFLLLTVPVLGAICGWSAPSAGAATCGTLDPKTHVVAKARLELDPDSVTTIAYRRDTAPQELLIRFKAAGCVLPKQPRRPRIDVLPKQNIKDVPGGALTLKRVITDDSDYSVLFTADPMKFSPGTYGGFVQVRAPFLSTARAPIALSRSETNELVVVGLGLLGGLASLVWFLGLRLAKGATTPIQWWHYVLAFLAAAVAGILATDTAYRAQDVWSFGENGGSAVVAAFTGATTGAMVAALAVLFPEPANTGEAAPPKQTDQSQHGEAKPETGPPVIPGARPGGDLQDPR